MAPCTYFGVVLIRSLSYRWLLSTDNSVGVKCVKHGELCGVIISECERLPSLIDELNEGQSSVLLNGVLPLLSVKDKSKLIGRGG